MLATSLGAYIGVASLVPAIAYSQSNDRTFRIVRSESKEFEQLRAIFEKILVPLYGSQEDALNKIALGVDRVCHLLYEIESPVGVIAFKKVLSDEYVTYGVKKSVEIKSLFVVDPEVNSGKGIGSALLDKVAEEVHNLKLVYDSLHVTVSETKQDSLIFFQKKGFRIIHKWEGRYIRGVIEFLLSRPADVAERERERERVVNEAMERANQVTGETANKKRFRLVCVAAAAHWDDIHAIKLLSDGTFVTGSKDNTIRKWDRRGEVAREVLDVEPIDNAQKEREWITAIAVLNDNYWISALRSGRIDLWNTQGDYIKKLPVRRPGNDHKSMRNNKHRVNCLAVGLDHTNPTFFAGFPTMFCEYNVIEGKTVSSAKVHRNDWVYAIHPLSTDSNLVVIAGSVENWTRSGNRWRRHKVIYQERKVPYGSRAHIAAFTPLQSDPTHFAMGIFGGIVSILDVEKSQIVNEWVEHSNRVWAVENISPHTFASSGEEGLIRLWDARLDKSVGTIKSYGGEVCAMMQLEENLLVAGVSPFKANMSNEGAQLHFYDFREFEQIK